MLDVPSQNEKMSVALVTVHTQNSYEKGVSQPLHGGLVVMALDC